MVNFMKVSFKSYTFSDLHVHRIPSRWRCSVRSNERAGNETSGPNRHGRRICWSSWYPYTTHITLRNFAFPNYWLLQHTFEKFLSEWVILRIIETFPYNQISSFSETYFRAPQRWSSNLASILVHWRTRSVHQREPPYKELENWKSRVIFAILFIFFSKFLGFRYSVMEAVKAATDRAEQLNSKKD